LEGVAAMDVGKLENVRLEKSQKEEGVLFAHPGQSERKHHDCFVNLLANFDAICLQSHRNGLCWSLSY
jgi:hypothetical protein